jgi:uncharacterized protein (TIGR02452 family)
MSNQRIQIAEETLQIQNQGYYTYNGKRVDFGLMQKLSEETSELITPQEGQRILGSLHIPEVKRTPRYIVKNQSTVDVITDTADTLAVLNFASAKNPGGGFLRGSIAQEEALAYTSGLYNTQIKHPDYYEANKECKTMMYTDHAIYSPSVVFFRADNFHFLPSPVKAAILTIPAVNMREVIAHKEDAEKAKQVMKNRMRLILAIFAQYGHKIIVLGAFGCGVFGNNANEIARWWKELLKDEGYGSLFDEVIFAVLDRIGRNIAPFNELFGMR